jgi:hypothetical protein
MIVTFIQYTMLRSFGLIIFKVLKYWFFFRVQYMNFHLDIWTESKVNVYRLQKFASVN